MVPASTNQDVGSFNVETLEELIGGSFWPAQLQAFFGLFENDLDVLLMLRYVVVIGDL